MKLVPLMLIFGCGVYLGFNEEEWLWSAVQDVRSFIRHGDWNQP